MDIHVKFFTNCNFVNELSLLLLQRSLLILLPSLTVSSLWSETMSVFCNSIDTAQQTPSALLSNSSDKKCGGEKKRKLKCF